MSSLPPLLALRPAPRPVEEIVGWFARGARTLVALSGGVDSAVVAALARAGLGASAEAVTFVGPSVSAEEIDVARTIAGTIGIAHHLLPVDPLEDPDYRENREDRCYHCRRIESSAWIAWGRVRGFERLVDGVHVDDLGDDRPGLRALAEAGVEHPLLWAGWRKADVRAYGREIALPNWDAPSNACLASRIPHGEPVTRERLAQVERAESAIRALGFRRVRVRTSDGRARVEVDPGEVARLRSEAVAVLVEERLRGLGFRAVELDPAGYRPRPGA